MEQNPAPEAWKGHEEDDVLYGNPTFTENEFLRSFNSRVLRDHPDFDKSILAEFNQFFDRWEKEFERLDQVTVQSAHKWLGKYLKY